MIVQANCKGGRHSDVERKATYPLERILPLIGKGNKSNDGRVDLDGDLMSVNDKKLRMFKGKGCQCVKCGMKGSFFAKEMELHNARNNNCKTFSLQLYGMNENGEVIMTMDHIIPQSKGGDNKMYNLQPMCYVCNQNKNNEMPSVLDRICVWIMKNKYERTKLWNFVHSFYHIKWRIYDATKVLFGIRRKYK